MSVENTVTRTVELDTSNIQEQANQLRQKLDKLDELIADINNTKLVLNLTRRGGTAPDEVAHSEA